MSNLRRKQIYLDEESDQALKRLAVSTKTSEAEHIRRAIKSYITKQKVNKLTEADPLEELVGICDNPEGPRDASIHHDKYLYGKQV
ncbi:MAG: ribbon-helix-helix protein, CopG family [Pseudomonadota bacterium]